MKILQINSVYGFGSTGQIVKKIHQSCLEQGIDSYVIYGRKSAYFHKNKSIDDKHVFYIQNAFSEKWHVLNALLWDSHGLYSKDNTKAIIEKIESIQPDVIHLHNLHGFYVNYPMLFDYFKKKNVPLIWSLHDCWPILGFAAHFEHFYDENGNLKDKRHGVYPYRLLRQNKRNYEFKKKSFSDCNMVLVTPSKWLKEVLETSYLSKYRIEVIRNNVNTDIFKPTYDDSLLEKYGLKDKKIVLGVASIMSKQKGFNDYLQLAKQLPDDWRMVLIGVSNAQIKKLPANVIGIQRTDNAKTLAKWYTHATVFLNLTLEDTAPLVNDEAHACGLLVVSYQTGGSSETADICVAQHDIATILSILETNTFEKRIQVNQANMIQQYVSLYLERGNVHEKGVV